MRWLAYVWLTLGMALFGSATPVARLVGEELPGLAAAALRVMGAAAVLLPIAVGRGLRWRHVRAMPWRVAALAVVGMFGFTVLLIEGMQRVTGVTGAVVMGTTPAVTAAAAVWFLHESATWRRWAGVGLAVLGVVALRLTGGGEGFDLLGAALVFGAVAAEATYTLVGKGMMERLDAVQVSAVAAAAAVPLFIPLLWWRTPDWSGTGWTAWAALAWWSLGTLVLGSIVWYQGVKQVPGHVAAAFMGVMPVSALVLSYWLLGEAPRWWHAPGFVLVVAAVGLVAWDHESRH